MKYLIILLLCFLYNTLLAQNIKQIIEWQRPNLDTTAIAKRVKNFDKNGNLINFYCEGNNNHNFREVKGQYVYDEQNRLVQKEIWIQTDYYYKTNYTYEHNKIIIREEDNSWQGVRFTYQYLNNKGLVIEEKNYNAEGYGKDTKLVLEEWAVKKYDKTDKLIEEKFIKAIGDSHGTKTKRIYEYDKSNNKITKITTQAFEEDYGQRIQDETTFKYDDLGKLIDKEYQDRFYQHNWNFQTYKYKDGKLWTKETTNLNEKRLDIYKNNKLIRTKFYDFTDLRLIGVTDYQYIYYEN